MWLLIYLIIKNIPIGIIIKIKRKNGKADYNISLLDQPKLLTGKKISVTSDMWMIPPIAESEEELKRLW